MTSKTNGSKKLAKKDKNSYKKEWYMYRYRKYKENENKPRPDWVPKPLEKKCFQCKNSILVKFVIPQKNYSLKNNWEYWTHSDAEKPDFWQDKEARKKDKYICDKCLINLYNDKFRYWSTITNPRKKQRMKTYIYTGTIFSD